MKKVIAAAIISPLLISLSLFGLAACGSSSSSATVPAKTQLEQENEVGLQFSTFSKKMQSGKIVECVGRAYDGVAASSITCDFEHAK